MCSFLRKGYFLEHVFFAVLLLFRPSLSSLKWWCLDRLLKGANIKRTQTFLCTVFLIKDPRRPMACTFFGSTSHPVEIIVISYLNISITLFWYYFVAQSVSHRTADKQLPRLSLEGSVTFFDAPYFLSSNFLPRKIIFILKKMFDSLFFRFAIIPHLKKNGPSIFYNLYSNRHKDAL